MLDDTILEEVTRDGYHPLLLTEAVIKDSLRRLTCQCEAVPVLMGSSLRKVRVTLLLDAATNYLPSPAERTIEL